MNHADRAIAAAHETLRTYRALMGPHSELSARLEADPDLELTDEEAYVIGRYQVLRSEAPWATRTLRVYREI